MTKPRLICLVGAFALLMSGCATTEKHPAAARAPAPPPPPPETLPLKTQERILPPELCALPDPIDVLVKQVDALYSSGMDDYRLGNLEKSKEEFNQAISTLLESGLDVQGDERLSAEFDKIVENVYSAEAASLERGDALSLHNFEPTPLDTFSGLTFPNDPRTRQRVQQELKSVHSDLPLVSNDDVAGIIAYFQNHARGYVDNVLRGVGRYGDVIGEALRKQGLPQDLIYLAAGESAFNPLAVSKAQCVGIWQFSQGTGALYGLKKNRWVDDRKDPVKSTEAAAHHLKDLYQTFGDWFLVMAAYDSGPLTVQRAIEKTGYADYWDLRRLHALPEETENYVPIFLATALIGKDPKAYGFDTQPDPPLEIEQVEITTPTDLRLIAQLVDHPVEDLVKLNPSLQQWTTPGNDPSFTLNLPAGTKEQYLQAIASVPADKRLWWRAHKVLEGETLAGIAKEYRVSPVALAEANQLTATAALDQGSHLIVPMAAGSEASLTRTREALPLRLISYRVRPGDTVDLIADRYEVSAYQIRRWNGLRTSTLTTGRTLHLYVATSGTTTTRSRTGTHRPATRPVATHPVTAHSSATTHTVAALHPAARTHAAARHPAATTHAAAATHSGATHPGATAAHPPAKATTAQRKPLTDANHASPAAALNASSLSQ